MKRPTILDTPSRWSRFLFTAVLATFAIHAAAQIPRATDGPKPLGAFESAKTFRLPAGFRVELIASEPLITEPSGVCWDERGRLFVSELHGYNVDGHLDILELNKTGKLDTDIKRIRGTAEAKKRAEPETFGVIKLLRDRDGDGRMDDAIVWATNLPPVYGIVPARGGIIAACAPDIVFLADRDGDGRPDVRETLFTGFAVGELERGLNAPQWGVDNWIYFGAGWGGSKVTGPRFKGTVELGRTDFRIKPDGSAIEPVEGETGTFGHAMTVGGDRFFTSTSQPSRYAVPLPWRYLARNPDAAMPRLINDAHDTIDTFPIAPVHPWRQKRSEDPRWVKFYGSSETRPQGYFTSACSPFLYDDVNWPSEFRGQLFVCDPAQSLVARLELSDDGAGYKSSRPAGVEKTEFLVAADSWFRPIYLTHAPDGSVWLVDMYREFIEDFSAIPRFLQQQYDLLAGRDKGRLWRISHQPKETNAKHVASSVRAGGRAVRSSNDMAALSNARLAEEVTGPHRWRRDTARRVLIERQAKNAVPALQRQLSSAKLDSSATVNLLYTLDGLEALAETDLTAAWKHPSPDVKRQVLRLADRHFTSVGKAIEKKLFAAPSADTHPRLLLQIAASLGESRNSRATAALAALSRQHGDVRWMDAAVMSSVHRRERELFASLAPQPGKATNLLEPLIAAISARGNTNEIVAMKADVNRVTDAGQRQLFTRVLEAGWADAAAALPKLEPFSPPQPPSVDFLSEVEKLAPKFVAALAGKRDPDRGRELFREHCASCHQAKGLGVAVGPNLDSERQRAEETILRDLLAPSEIIRPGFETYVVQSKRGGSYYGILAAESPTSVTLRLPSGDELTLLRKRIDRARSHKVSLMPATFAQTLEPAAAADIIAFLRAP